MKMLVAWTVWTRSPQAAPGLDHQLNLAQGEEGRDLELARPWRSGILCTGSAQLGKRVSVAQGCSAIWRDSENPQRIL